MRTRGALEGISADLWKRSTDQLQIWSIPYTFIHARGIGSRAAVLPARDARHASVKDLRGA